MEGWPGQMTGLPGRLGMGMRIVCSWMRGLVKQKQ